MNNDSPNFSVLIGALILFLLMLLGSFTASAQDSLYVRRYQPMEVSYHLFSNVRQTNMGTASNTDLFLGAKSGNVSVGVGYVRQVFANQMRNTDFQAITPQAKFGFGFNNYFYFGPSTTIWKRDDYVETYYGLEIGLFIQH